MGAKQGADDSFDFLIFWEVYPRKAGKGAARIAWRRATARADPDVVIAGARRYRDDPNRMDTYTAHPTTWLNQERWTDDPLPPRLGNRDQRSVNNLLDWIGDAEGRNGTPRYGGAVDAASRGVPRGDL